MRSRTTDLLGGKAPGPEWTEAERLCCQAWQQKLHFKGKDADGTPGRVSWEKLRVPNS